MDPNTGKIYSLDDPDISDEIRARLVPIEDVDDLKKLVEVHDKLQARRTETPYSPNRADRRAASRNSRKKRSRG